MYLGLPTIVRCYVGTYLPTYPTVVASNNNKQLQQPFFFPLLLFPPIHPSIHFPIPAFRFTSSHLLTKENKIK